MLREEFWDHVAVGPDCWNWAGTRLSAGYGHFYINGEGKQRGQRKLAHRHSFEIHNGPIPKGYDVCHNCDNPSCVNPKHLWLGTRAENIQDAHNKGRGYKPSPKSICVNGHAMTPDNTMLTKHGWRKCRECGRQQALECYYRRRARG